MRHHIYISQAPDLSQATQLGLEAHEAPAWLQGHFPASSVDSVSGRSFFTRFSQVPFPGVGHCTEKKFSTISALGEHMAQLRRRDHLQLKTLPFLHLSSEVAEALKEMNPQLPGLLSYSTTQISRPSVPLCSFHRWTPFSSPPRVVSFFFCLWRNVNYFHLYLSFIHHQGVWQES